MYSKEYKAYLKKLKIHKFIVIFFQIFILISFLIIWELSAKAELINSFLTSYPSEIIKTAIELFKDNNLLSHIFVTTYETVISFSLATVIGIIIASILWSSRTIANIFDPYLTVLNSLPKVS